MVESGNNLLIELGELAVNAAREAGKVILSYYKQSITIDNKSDGSPLTIADMESHKLICSFLSTTQLPVVSEEAKELSIDSSMYWLVDPLDGTKDFIAGNDEFTINIAIIRSGKPILGVLYAPALDELYFGIPGNALWYEQGGIRNEITKQPKVSGLSMAKSRFHDHPDSDIFAVRNEVKSFQKIGSALKFGRLVRGLVDVYPRFEGSSEWDIAAGQAILEAAGGSVINLSTHKSLSYSKPSRRNGTFLAFRNPYSFEDFTIK